MHELGKRRKALVKRRTAVGCQAAAAGQPAVSGQAAVAGQRAAGCRNVARGLRGPSLLAARANLLRCLLRDARLEKCVQLPM
jgi:hypothetical protein